MVLINLRIFMLLDLDRDEALDVLRSFAQDAFVSDLYDGNQELPSALGCVFGVSFEYSDFSGLTLGEVVALALKEGSDRLR